MGIYKSSFFVLLLSILWYQGMAANELPSMKVEWFSDETRNITLEEAPSLNYQPLENGLLKVGYSRNIEWLKITIDKPDLSSRDLLVCFSKNITDSITFYFSENGTLNSYISGLHVADSDNKLDGSAIYFPVAVQKPETVFFARIVSSYSKQMSIELMDYHERERIERNDELVKGIYIGALLIITLYNIFLGFSIRDKLYYHYALANVSTMISILAIRGSLGNILPDAYVQYNPIFQSSVHAFWAVLSVNFSIRLLNIRKFSKVGYYLLIGSSAFMVLNIFIYNFTLLIHPPIMYSLFPIGAFVYSLCSIVVGIIALKKGSRYARYYLLGWSIFFFGVILLTLSYSGVIERNPFTLNASLIGSVLEVLLLSFALADRYRYLQDERDTLERNLKHKEGDLSMVINDNRMRHQFRKNVLEGMEEINRSENSELRSKLSGFITDLKLQIETEEKFNFIQNNISAINSEFDALLQNRFPALNASEREMCQLIKLNLSVKEIARIRKMSEGAVKASRHRIRRKMNLDSLDVLQKL